MAADARTGATADFSCTVCYEQATEPVVTKCGHLFCWECLDKWLVSSGSEKCPVCLGHVGRNVPGDIIPLYGKGRPVPSTAGVHATSLPTAATAAAPRGASAAPEAAAHERPRANREPLPPGQDGAEQNGGGNNWMIGGGGFFFVAPALDPFFLSLVIMGLVAYFFPWRAVWNWLHGWWRTRRGAAAGPGDRERPAEQRQPLAEEQGDFRIFGLVLFGLAVFQLFAFLLDA
jgi:hypothetical protein